VVDDAALRQRALRWLAQRDHSRHELERKLLEWAREQARRQAAAELRAPGPEAPPRGVAHDPAGGAAPDVEGLASRVAAALDAVQRRGWLNTERFIESRIAARQARHGNRRITAELRQHGLTVSAEQATALAATELARAQAVLARRFGPPGAALTPEAGHAPSAEDEPDGWPDRRPRHDGECDEPEPAAATGGLHAARRRAARAANPADEQRRERLRRSRFLAARGFSPAVIAAALKAHGLDDD
jgi:regulatory protein